MVIALAFVLRFLTPAEVTGPAPATRAPGPLCARTIPDRDGPSAEDSSALLYAHPPLLYTHPPPENLLVHLVRERAVERDDPWANRGRRSKGPAERG